MARAFPQSQPCGSQHVVVIDATKSLARARFLDRRPQGTHDVRYAEMFGRVLQPLEVDDVRLDTRRRAQQWSSDQRDHPRKTRGFAKQPHAFGTDEPGRAEDCHGAHRRRALLGLEGADRETEVTPQCSVA